VIGAGENTAGCEWQRAIEERREGEQVVAWPEIPAPGGRGAHPMGQDGVIEEARGAAPPTVRQCDRRLRLPERGAHRIERIASAGNADLAGRLGQLIHCARTALAKDIVKKVTE
jgi:hypothetical protein